MTLHGECKTPGGKLVTVDLTVRDGLLAEVRIRGDFFVHPEPQTATALATIAIALTGLAADMESSAFASHIRAALAFDVELVGTSPEAIAIAVCRAVTRNADEGTPPSSERVGAFTAAAIDARTQSWKSLPWRLLAERPLSPAMNVSLDEVLTDRISRGESPPTLRFWRWNAPAVIVGRCQAVENEVDLDAAAAMGVQVVRRMTGGGAMFLQPHGAITYSLYLPERAVAGLTIRESYEVCEAWVIRALRDLGVDAHHVPINDIACSAGKIGGAAQARRGGVVLHHTTIAYDMDPGEMVKVLRIGREKLKDKAVASASKRVSPLVHQTGLSRSAIGEHLFASFRERFGGTESELTIDELVMAEQLVATKYGTTEWTKEFG